jgi:hypothetical protein
LRNPPAASHTDHGQLAVGNLALDRAARGGKLCGGFDNGQ